MLEYKSILITNVPSPYRAKQYNIIGNLLADEFIIAYTNKNYPTTKMKWERPLLTHNYIFLDTYLSIFIPKFFKTFIFLLFQKPNIIVTAGFNLTMITSFIFSKLFKKKHIVFTDSWLHPVQQLSYIHRFIRKIIIKRSDGAICVGKKGKEYLKHFGANSSNIYISRLSDSIKFLEKSDIKKEFHFIFSGQLIERKQPLFFVEVVKEVARTITNLKVLIIGSGPLENLMLTELKKHNITYVYKGFVAPNIVKKYYSKAKILLFPTINDPWGMVTNDAMSVGLPVITTPYAGVADDLVIDNYNGFIIDLDKKIWVDKSIQLLQDKNLYNSFSKNAKIKIKEFTVDKAAEDFVTAIKKIA